METKGNGSKRQRKPNWDPREINVLLQEIQIEATKLFGGITPNNTNAHKAIIWQKIARAVSSIGTALRSVDDVKSKWKNMKKEVLEEDFSVRKTGGGPHTKRFNPYEELVRAIIGERSSLYSGIDVDGCEESGKPELAADQAHNGMAFVVSGDKGPTVVNVTVPLRDGVIDLPCKIDHGILTTSKIENGVPTSTIPGNTPKSTAAAVLPSTSYVDMSTAESPMLDRTNNFSVLHVDNSKEQSPMSVDQDCSYNVADAGATPFRMKGLKSRLQNKRKHSSMDRGRSFRRKPNTQSADEDPESALFQEYLKSEIEKNKMLNELMQEKLKLCRNINGKLFGSSSLSKNRSALCEQDDTRLTEHLGFSMTLDETFV